MTISKNFGGIESKFSSYQTSKILLQAILYDGTSTWGKGADKGFEKMIEASHYLELYDIETNSEVYKKGIHTLPPLFRFSSPEDMIDQVKRKTRELIQSNKFLSFFGGEHSISIGVIQALKQAYENLTVVQFDAHADLRPTYEGSQYNHACAMHWASRNCNLIQIGIRSMDASEIAYMDLSKVFLAENIYNHTGWIDDCLNKMSQNVYISFDLDVFDPSIMPATGTPEPGGLDWYNILKALSAIFRNKNVIAFDIVELAPIENCRHPDFTVAKLYYKMLSYKFANNEN